MSPSPSSRRVLVPVLVALTAFLVTAVAVVAILIAMDARRADGSGTAAPATATRTVTAPPTTAIAPVTPAAPASVVEPAGSVVVEGGVCLDSEVRTFGTDAVGRSLVCGYSGTSVPHWWGHADDDGATHEVGAPCDPAVDGVSRDGDGLFIMCGGETWVTHP